MGPGFRRDDTIDLTQILCGSAALRANRRHAATRDPAFTSRTTR